MSDNDKERPTNAPSKHTPAGSSVEAQALLLLESQRAERVQQEAVLSDDSKWQYYVRCQRCHDNGRYHIGIFLTKNPRSGLVYPGDWYATYKELDKGWWGDAFCQVCYDIDDEGDMLGEEYPLPFLTYQPTTRKKGTVFIVGVEALWRYPKSAELRKEIAPHRAMRVPYRSGNKQLDEIERSLLAPSPAPLLASKPAPLLAPREVVRG